MAEAEPVGPGIVGRAPPGRHAHRADRLGGQTRRHQRAAVEQVAVERTGWTTSPPPRRTSAPRSPPTPAPTRKSGASVRANGGALGQAQIRLVDLARAARTARAARPRRRGIARCGVHDANASVTRSGPIRRPPSTGVKCAAERVRRTALRAPPRTRRPRRARRPRRRARAAGAATPRPADRPGARAPRRPPRRPARAAPAAASRVSAPSPSALGRRAARAVAHQQASAATASGDPHQVGGRAARDRVFCSSRSTTLTS